MNHVRLSPAEFLVKLKEIEDDANYIAVYDGLDDTVKIVPVRNGQIDGDVCVSPVLGRMPPEEYKGFKIGIDLLAGESWLAMCRGVTNW